MSSSGCPSKPPIPYFLRISLPIFGKARPDNAFADVVEVRRETTFEPAPGNQGSVLASFQDSEVPYEVVPPFVRKIERRIAYGVCRIVCQSHRLVVKFVLGRQVQRREALEREAKYYNTCLLAVQGSVVPYMFGYYKGTTYDERKLPVFCMILEDCGDRLTQGFGELPLDDRFVSPRLFFYLQVARLTLS